MDIISAQGLVKGYNNSLIGKITGINETRVLKDVSLTVKGGDFIGIMGRSGCGKTTLLKILGTIDKTDKGKVFYGDRDVSKLRDEELAELRRKKIGFVFQEFQLMNNLSVEENIMLPMILDGKKYKEMEKVVRENAGILEIEHVLKKEPYELSGGEKQRVAIARALSNDPDIIFADEPTGNLDLDTAINIMSCFGKINNERNKAIIMVTHDPLVASYCKSIHFLRDGSMKETFEKTESQDDFYDQIVKTSSKVR